MRFSACLSLLPAIAIATAPAEQVFLNEAEGKALGFSVTCDGSPHETVAEVRYPITIESAGVASGTVASYGRPPRQFVIRNDFNTSATPSAILGLPDTKTEYHFEVIYRDPQGVFKHYNLDQIIKARCQGKERK
jgi:hypothetical protein